MSCALLYLHPLPRSIPRLHPLFPNLCLSLSPPSSLSPSSSLSLSLFLPVCPSVPLVLSRFTALLSRLFPPLLLYPSSPPYLSLPRSVPAEGGEMPDYKKDYYFEKLRISSKIAPKVSRVCVTQLYRVIIIDTGWLSCVQVDPCVLHGLMIPHPCVCVSYVRVDACVCPVRVCVAVCGSFPCSSLPPPRWPPSTASACAGSSSTITGAYPPGHGSTLTTTLPCCQTLLACPRFCRPRWLPKA